MMSGYTRLSYSAVILMLEATNSFNFAIPMILAVWITRLIANFLCTSLYERELRSKQMPFLSGKCPAETQNLKAAEIMSKDVLTIPSIIDMKTVELALSSNYNAFPVLNTCGHLVGLLPKNILNELAKEKHFYDYQ